jgi:hypothetical protein
VTIFMDAKVSYAAAAAQEDHVRSFTPAGQQHTDSKLVIKNPAPDSSPPAVSDGTYSEGILRR